MAIASDFTIDYVSKRVTHTSNTVVYTVNALYSYLMDTFDEPEQMDDTVPMSAQTPTDYTLINSWFMDDNSYKFLKGGAIKTVGYLNNIQIVNLQVAGYIAAINTDLGKTVTDDAGNTGSLLAYNNTTRKWWVRWTSAIATASVMAIVTGTGAGTSIGASVSGEDLFPNVYTLGSIEELNNQQIYIIQSGASLIEWWPEIGSGTRHVDVLIKTTEAGTAIDSGKITVFLRNYQAGGSADLYDHFDIDLHAGGRNACPLATSPDLNNTSSKAIVSGYNDITIAFVNGTIAHAVVTGGPFTNYESLTGGTSSTTAIFLSDVAGVMTLANVKGTFQSGEVITGGTSGAHCTTTSTIIVINTTTRNFIKQGVNNYSVIIDCAGRRLSQVYEYLKYILCENSVFQTYGIKSTSGTLSINKMDGEQYIRAFTDITTPATSYSPVKAAPFGTFAGGKFFGARGVWVENINAADILNFQLIDSTNATRTPPNQQTIIISNLLANDRVAVFRTTSGTTIDKTTYTAAVGNNLGLTAFITNEAISNDTPATGTLRIIDTSDTTATREIRYTYTAWSGSTFTGLSPSLDRNYSSGVDTCYIPFIDTIAAGTSAACTVIYVADRSILIRVRRYTAAPILPFETTGTFGSTGYSTTAIRTPDTIVT